MDSSTAFKDKDKLHAKIRLADCVLALYDVTRPETMEALRCEWLPLVISAEEISASDDFAYSMPSVENSESAHGLDSCSQFEQSEVFRDKNFDSTSKRVILVGTKIDLLGGSEGENRSQYELQQLNELVAEFPIVAACCRSSAKLLVVDSVFHYAELCVAFPLEPLFDRVENKFTPACERAFGRIFRLLDRDRSGGLCDSELCAFQGACFGESLSTTELTELKRMAISAIPDSLRDGELTWRGLLGLIRCLLLRSQPQSVWTILRHFDYDENLSLFLPEDFSCDNSTKGSASPGTGVNGRTELSRAALIFLTQAAQVYPMSDACPQPPSKAPQHWAGGPYSAESASLQHRGRNQIADGLLYRGGVGENSDCTQSINTFTLLDESNRHSPDTNTDQSIRFLLDLPTEHVPSVPVDMPTLWSFLSVLPTGLVFPLAQVGSTGIWLDKGDNLAAMAGFDEFFPVTTSTASAMTLQPQQQRLVESQQLLFSDFPDLFYGGNDAAHIDHSVPPSFNAINTAATAASNVTGCSPLQAWLQHWQLLAARCPHLTRALLFALGFSDSGRALNVYGQNDSIGGSSGVDSSDLGVVNSSLRPLEAPRLPLFPFLSGWLGSGRSYSVICRRTIQLAVFGGDDSGKKTVLRLLLRAADCTTEVTRGAATPVAAIDEEMNRTIPLSGCAFVPSLSATLRRMHYPHDEVAATAVNAALEELANISSVRTSTESDSTDAVFLVVTAVPASLTAEWLKGNAERIDGALLCVDHSDASSTSLTTVQNIAALLPTSLPRHYVITRSERALMTSSGDSSSDSRDDSSSCSTNSHRLVSLARVEDGFLQALSLPPTLLKCHPNGCGSKYWGEDVDDLVAAVAVMVAQPNFCIPTRVDSIDTGYAGLLLTGVGRNMGIFTAVTMAALLLVGKKGRRELIQWLGLAPYLLNVNK
jgi:hypothetical protein